MEEKKRKKKAKSTERMERKPNWQEVYATVEDIRQFLSERVSLRYNVVTRRVEVHWLTDFGDAPPELDDWEALTDRRRKLQNKIRRATPEVKVTLREEKANVTARITELRKRLKLNEGIEERSLQMKEKTDLLYANEYRAQEEQQRKKYGRERDAR